MEVTESAAAACPAKEQHHQQKTEGAASTDNCDICVATSSSTTTMEEVETNKFTPTAEGTKAEGKNTEGVKAFELAESVESQEETDDESDDGEMRQFLNLMNKAERKNQKRVQVQAVQTIHLGSSRSASSRADWRTELGDPESDTTDTDDEDDTVETRRFLSLMGKQPRQEKQMVNIRWQDGRVVGLPGNIKVTRVPVSEEVRRRHEQDLIARRRAHLEAIRREGPPTTTCSGKRKFEERMTLSEAKADDFTDTKDYVDFIQAKLKNVNIKIIK